MALDTNSAEYKTYYDNIDNTTAMGTMSLPAPGSGILKDFWWADPKDYSQGISGEKPNRPVATESKKFLWMPRKYGIPVAIIGVTVLAFGAYKFFTRAKA